MFLSFVVGSFKSIVQLLLDKISLGEIQEEITFCTESPTLGYFSHYPSKTKYPFSHFVHEVITLILVPLVTLHMRQNCLQA